MPGICYLDEPPVEPPSYCELLDEIDMANPLYVKCYDFDDNITYNGRIWLEAAT